MAASAQTPTARGTDNICDSLADYDRDRFDDTRGSAHERNVLCMADFGLTEGTNASGGQSYAPRADVTRGQMASFIARFLEEYTGEALPAGDPVRFDDVPTTEAEYVHAENINNLAALDVIAGTNASGGDLYEPNEEVTRAQTASLIRRALSWLETGDALSQSAPPAGPDAFGDDDGLVPHEANIDALAAAGIVEGFEAGDYRPFEYVKRDQMASFVMRGFDYAVEFELGVPPVDPDDPVAFDVELSWFNELIDTGDAGDGALFGQGEVGATADATLLVDPAANTVDFTLDYEGVSGPFDGAPGFHIHEGAFDENGDVVVGLATGAELQEADSSLTGTDVAPEADFDVQSIIDDPDGFYLNLHSDDFPEGAVRGQVSDVAVDLNVFDVAVDTVDTTVEGVDVVASSYTATGLDPDAEYRVTLVDATNVTLSDDGAVFDAVNPDNTADAGPPEEAALVTINGELFVPDDLVEGPFHTDGNISPNAEGEITFDAIQGEDDVVAFIYPEGGDSTFLEVVGDGAVEGVPAGTILEKYGIGPVVEGLDETPV